MKLTKEEFNKLPQLDRIEYRQRLDYLEKNKKYNTFKFISNVAMLLFLFLSVTLIISFLNYDASLKLMAALPYFLTGVFIGLIFLLGIDMLYWITFIKNKEAIEREYFCIINKGAKK